MDNLYTVLPALVREANRTHLTKLLVKKGSVTMQPPTAQATAQAIVDTYFHTHAAPPQWWTDLVPPYDWDTLEGALNPTLASVKSLFYHLLEALQRAHPELEEALRALEAAAADWVTADGDVRFLLGIATGKQLARQESKPSARARSGAPTEGSQSSGEPRQRTLSVLPHSSHERPAGGRRGAARRTQEQRGK